MTAQVLVCPHDPALFSRLSGRKVAVRLSRGDDPCRAARDVEARGCTLHCIAYDAGTSLSDIPFSDQWNGIPLSVHARAIGDFKTFFRMLPLLRELNLRLYLPLDLAENYAGLRILASLGLGCAAEFGGRPVDWAALTDLMTYGLLGRVARAPLDPFSYIAEKYAPDRTTSWQAVYRDDPEKHLHLDQAGRVALSARDLAQGVFIAESIEDLCESELAETCRRLRSLQDPFLTGIDGCGSCPGWRVCGGAFGATAAADPGCRNFFTELLDTLELHQGLASRKHSLWRH
jgi:hypothetical protein